MGAGTNTGLTLTYILGYLASRPDLQEKAFQEIITKYGNGIPDTHGPYELEFIRALHMVSFMFIETFTRY